MAPQHPTEEITAWFADQLPDEWFDDGPTVLVDRDEILLLGAVGCPAIDDGVDGERARVEQEQIQAFRERTREARVGIAERAQALFGRQVSWGAECGATRMAFTHLSAPVMTRLRIDERRILDTLVAAGVARSRSEALGWCVRLVGEHEGDWITELRDALDAVEQVRARRT